MSRLLAVAMVSSLGLAQARHTSVTPDQSARTQYISNTETTTATLPPLPSIPAGKSTVVGGAIHDVDPVRDQLILSVSGGKQRMKILFDERTQVYRDGVRTALRDLRPKDHASIETVLDGTNVFAISIHTLTETPEGECQGQVMNYNPSTGDMIVSDGLSREPIKLRVLAATILASDAQTRSSFSTPSTAASITKGTLVSVRFRSGNNGQGIADRVTILATPGSTFVFDGNVTFLDLHAKLFVIVDPRDDRSYKIFFDPARFPISKSLQEGIHVSVNASFDGTKYVANTIKTN
jgi:hypothetical protein